MYLLHLLPTAFSSKIIFLLLIIGIACVFLSYFSRLLPFIKPYSLIIKIVGAVLIAVSLYLKGGYDLELAYKQKVAELEVKLAKAEAEAAKKNVEIQEKIITKTNVVREKGQNIIEYIDREVVKKEEVIKYIENCPIPKDIIDSHNAAATLNKAAQKLAEDKK